VFLPFAPKASRTGPAKVIDLVETSYLLGGEEVDWVARVVEAAGDFDYGLGVFGIVQRRMGDGVRTQHMVVRSTEAMLRWVAMAQESIGLGVLADVFESPVARSGTFVEQLELAGLPTSTFFDVARPYGVADAFGLITQLSDGTFLTLVAPSPTRVTATRQQSRRWQRLAAHLGTGLRLKRRLAAEALSPELVLSPKGRLLHVESGVVPTHSALLERATAGVLATERARGRLRREAPDEALSLWQGLVAGRWSLADRVESDGKRFVVAFRNELELERPHDITQREAAVARWAAGGAGLKEVAYALGIGVSSVHEALTRAMRKLKVKDRAELAAMWTAAQAPVGSRDIVGVSLVGAEDALCGLTNSERHVAELVVAGHPVAAIAALRSTSVNTVTNQLSALYRKLGVRSRAELAARLGGAG
jgi:DNA-binding CsgD family transcriptional regulator